MMFVSIVFGSTSLHIRLSLYQVLAKVCLGKMNLEMFITISETFQKLYHL